jgi:hypothetical protein
MALALVPFFFLLIFSAGLLLLFVFYYKNIQDMMLEVAPHNQQVPPSNIWLMFIPLFNLVYGFIIYPKVCDSVRLEFQERGESQGGDYGRGLAIALPILRICMIIPLLNWLAFPGWLIVWIIYWVKMAEFKKQLRALPKTADGGVKFSANNDLLD